jgi:hypothetical protein
MRIGWATALALTIVASAGATTGPGLYGVVTRSPTKPVCTPDYPCSEPAAHVSLRFYRGSALVKTVVTDGRGHYRAALRRGVYLVRIPGARTIGSGIDPRVVRVGASWRHQDFDIDTGIR